LPPVVVSLAEGGETTAAPFNKLLNFKMLATGAEYGWSSRNLMIPWMLCSAMKNLLLMSAWPNDAKKEQLNTKRRVRRYTNREL
jgi:hypothetical protein